MAKIAAEGTGPTRYVALFRGVNVGAAGAVAMGDLSLLLTSLGLDDVRTYIRSGNAVFAAPGATAAALAGRIEVAFDERFGFSPRVLVVEAADLVRIVDADPFAGKEGDPDGRYMTFLMDEPSGRTEEDIRLLAGETGADRFALGGGCVYVYCPEGYAHTRLSNAFFEKRKPKYTGN